MLVNGLEGYTISKCLLSIAIQRRVPGGLIPGEDVLALDVEETTSFPGWSAIPIIIRGNFKKEAMKC